MLFRKLLVQNLKSTLENVLDLTDYFNQYLYI